MNMIERIYSEDSGPAGFARRYFDYLGEIMSKMDTDQIEAMIEAMIQARERGSKILFVGNGGSAATASHFANDIAIGTRSWDKPFKALSLCDNVAVLSAVGNDDGYDQIFVQQLTILMEKNDLLVAISASGNSPNVVKAVEYANANGGITIGLTGFDGGELKKAAFMNVHVPSSKGEYGPVEDMHMVLDHLIGAYLKHYSQENQG